MLCEVIMEARSCRCKTDRRDGVEWPVIGMYFSEYVAKTLQFTIKRKIQRLESASSKMRSNHDFDVQFDGISELCSLIQTDPRLADHLNNDVLSQLCMLLKYKESKAAHLDNEKISSIEDAKHRKFLYYSAGIISIVVASRKASDVKDEAVSPLVDLIVYPDRYLQVVVLQALSNLCRTFPDTCGIIIDKGALEMLEPIFMDLYNHYSLLQASVRFLLVLGSMAPHLLTHKIMIVIRMLSSSIMSCFECVMVDTCMALSCFSRRRFISIETKVVDRLFKLIQCSIYPDPNVTFCALEVIGNYVRWAGDEHIQFMIEKDLVLHLKSLLKHHQRRVRKEACWIISNIAATSQIHAVSNMRLLDTLVSLVKKDKHDVKEIAAIAISNVVFDHQNKIQYLRRRCFEPLKDLVKCSHDPMIVTLCSEILDKPLTSTNKFEKGRKQVNNGRRRRHFF